LSSTISTQLGYPIVVESGALNRIGRIAADVAGTPRRFAIITDATVGDLYARRVASSFHSAPTIVTIEPGESQKNRTTWATITDRLIGDGFGRDSMIVALGGGVVGDLAGFVAGTFMRGIPFVQVPTTLLAMIDASIGGKTGVDTPAGKNLVGVFHPPSAVVIDPQVLATLMLKHRCAGFAEAIKHGVIADREYFDSIAGSLGKLIAPDGWSSEAMVSLIVRSIRIKTEIVAQDERESGRRRILNFGHTIGHAVEAASDYHLLHGESVAIGMSLESRLAERAGIAARDTAETIAEVLDRANLPLSIPQGISTGEVLEKMQRDKKSRAGKVEFSLPAEIGRMHDAGGMWSVAIEPKLVQEVLNDEKKK
jgi:3-dehydroquinate synthase